MTCITLTLQVALMKEVSKDLRELYTDMQDATDTGMGTPTSDVFGKHELTGIDI
jgi:hypothetical protein